MSIILSRAYTWCATGHRPPRLFPNVSQACAYSPAMQRVLVAYAERVLIRNKVDSIITGGAQGWDQAVAEAAKKLGIPYAVAAPCRNQESKWPAEAQKRYQAIVAGATDVVYVSETYHRACMILRDKWMVDNSEKTLALWDGVETGGTWATIEYALELGHRVVNCWKTWDVERGAL